MIMTDKITENIIGAAIEVHKILGPGLLESIYEQALCHELQLQNIFLNDKRMLMSYLKIKLLKAKDEWHMLKPVIPAKAEKWCMDAPFTNQRMEI